MSNKGKIKIGNPPPLKKKKTLLRYQSSCADVAPLEHFEKSLIEFHVRVRFIVRSSEGLGFGLGAGRFLSLAVSGETLLVCSLVVPQERACAARPARRLPSATGDQFVQRLVY